MYRRVSGLPSSVSRVNDFTITAPSSNSQVPSSLNLIRISPGRARKPFFAGAVGPEGDVHRVRDDAGSRPMISHRCEQSGFAQLSGKGRSRLRLRSAGQFEDLPAVVVQGIEGSVASLAETDDVDGRVGEFLEPDHPPSGRGRTAAPHIFPYA